MYFDTNYSYGLKWSSNLIYSVTTEAIDTRVRQKIKQILPCDVLKPENPFDPNDFEPGYFDCIVSSICLDTACPDKENLQTIIKKLGTYVRSAGQMTLGVGLQSTFYEFRGVKFPLISLHSTEVEAFMREAGFVNVKSEIETVPAPGCDASGIMVATGIKK